MLLESFATLRQKANDAWEKNAQQNRRVVLFHALPALALPQEVSFSRRGRRRRKSTSRTPAARSAS